MFIRWLLGRLTGEEDAATAESSLAKICLGPPQLAGILAPPHGLLPAWQVGLSLAITLASSPDSLAWACSLLLSLACKLRKVNARDLVFTQLTYL